MLLCVYMLVLFVYIILCVGCDRDHLVSIDLSFHSRLFICCLTISRHTQSIYGFASGDSLRFQRAAGHKDLFYVEEKDVEFKDVSN